MTMFENTKIENFNQVASDNGISIVNDAMTKIHSNAGYIRDNAELAKKAISEVLDLFEDKNSADLMITRLDFATSSSYSVSRQCKWQLAETRPNLGPVWHKIHTAALDSDITWGHLYLLLDLFQNYNLFFTDIKRDFDHITYLLRTAKLRYKEDKLEKAQEYLQRAADDIINYQPLLNRLVECISMDKNELMTGIRFEDEDEEGIPFDDESPEDDDFDDVENRESAVIDFVVKYLQSDKETQNQVHAWLKRIDAEEQRKEKRR